MKAITDKIVEKVVRETLTKKRLKTIALHALEDYILGLCMKDGDKTEPGDYNTLRDTIKKSYL